MKKFLRIGALCAAVAALAIGTVAPAGAGGLPVYGTLVITPDPAEVGGTVTVSNADDEESICEDSDGGDLLVEGWIYTVEDTGLEDQYFEVEPDEDGNWSVTLDIPNDDAAIGTWRADVGCYEYFGQVESQSTANFWYPLTDFEVVGADTPEPPEEETAPAEEVRAAPRFTG